MGKLMIFLFVTLFTVLLIAYYHLERWGENTRITLEVIRDTVESNYRENSETLFQSLRDDAMAKVKSEILPGMRNEISQLFNPDQKQDHLLKYDFKYAVRDNIQKDITETVRRVMKEDIKEITKEVIDKKGLGDGIKSYPENLCDRNKKLPPHQKILVYTVFGTRKLYYEGIPDMLKEAVASNLYYDWHIRIYHDALITPEVKAKYKHYTNLDFCDARKLPRYGNITHVLGKFWRNVPMADKSVDMMCSRDLDSALSLREEDAVRIFLKSDKLLHTMRDFKMHNAGMLAGMWCMKIATNRNMARQLFETLLEEAKSYTLRTDQPLLNKIIFDGIVDKKKYVLQHDSYLCNQFEGTVPFPTQRKDNMEFVGCPNHVCNWKGMVKCPVQCRPKEHQDWEYC